MVAPQDLVAVLPEELVGVDARLAGFHVDVVHVDVGIVVGERPCPQEPAARALDDEQAAAFGDRHHDVALLARHDGRADPLRVPRVGVQARAHEDALLVVIRIPIVAGKLLVVPEELARRDLERNGRIAVEIGRRGERYGIGAAMTRKPRIGVRVGDAPVQDLAFRIIGAGQAPGARGALLHRHVGPGVAAGLARRGRRVEPPDFLAGPGVVRRDEAVLALALFAGAVRDDLAIGNQQAAGRLSAVVDLGFPAQLARVRVERQQKSVRRREIDHVLVNSEALRARGRRGDRPRVLALVLPDQIPVGGGYRLDRGAGRVQIHDAAIDDRSGFLRAVRQTP